MFCILLYLICCCVVQYKTEIMNVMMVASCEVRERLKSGVIAMQPVFLI